MKNIKDLLEEGCRISMPYKTDPNEWVGETKIFIFEGGSGCISRIIVEGDYCNGYRKEFELTQLEEAIKYFSKNAFSSENLMYKMNEAVRNLTKDNPDFDFEKEEDMKATLKARQILLNNAKHDNFFTEERYEMLKNKITDISQFSNMKIEEFMEFLTIAKKRDEKK